WRAPSGQPREGRRPRPRQPDQPGATAFLSTEPSPPPARRWKCSPCWARQPARPAPINGRSARRRWLRSTKNWQPSRRQRRVRRRSCVAEIDPQASVATNSDANIGRANTSPQAVGAGQRTQGRYGGNGTLGAHRAIPSRDPNWSRAPVPIDPEQTTSCLTLLCSQALAYCAVRDITGAPGIAGIASSIFLRGDFEGGFSTCPPPNLWL